jgi:regulator of RNase E activity RraA
MASAIVCRSANPFICAPAFTIRCRGDFFGLVRAIESAAPGEVLVVDGGGQEIALAGELFAKTAQGRGIAGIIVDGGYRDMAYVSGCNLPVYSRFVTPMAGTTQRLGELQVPVSCGGVTVNHGDIVLADRDGIVVLEPGRVDELIRLAGEIKAVEDRVIAKLADGGSLSDCLNVAEHELLLSTGRASSLRFTV